MILTRCVANQKAVASIEVRGISYGAGPRCSLDSDSARALSSKTKRYSRTSAREIEVPPAAIPVKQTTTQSVLLHV